MDWIWVPIVGIVVWGAVGITYSLRSRTKNDGLQQALEDNAATNKALLAKLETIDNRLSVVEKTLTDIQ